MLLRRHGYPPEDPKFKRPMAQGASRAMVSHTLNATLRALEVVGVRPFLQSGSILGWVRGGKPLPWDDDDDIAVTEAEWVRLMRNKTRALRQVQGTLDLQGIEFKLAGGTWAPERFGKGSDAELEALAHKLTCGLCGRVRHRASGNAVDIFIWGSGHGPETRAARYRGSWKGCWRDGTSLVDPRLGGAGLNETAIHQKGDWHMFGWDAVLGRDQVLPVHAAEYGGISVWLPADPAAVAAAEFGICAGWYRIPDYFMLFGGPPWGSALLSGVLFGYVFVQAHGCEVLVSAVGVLIAGLCARSWLRSGFAAVALFLACACAALVGRGWRRRCAILVAIWILSPLLWGVLGYTLCWANEQRLMWGC